MKIKDLLSIQAGTLLKGLHINHDGSVTISLSGWHVEQNKMIKKLWSATGWENIQLVCYIDNIMSKVHPPGQIRYTDFLKEISFYNMKQNGIEIFKDLSNIIQTTVNFNDCVGMSLGETIFAIKPYYSNMYDPNYLDVYLLHKILQGNEIKFLMLKSNMVHKNSLLFNMGHMLHNSFIELV